MKYVFKPPFGANYIKLLGLCGILSLFFLCQMPHQNMTITTPLKIDFNQWPNTDFSGIFRSFFSSVGKAKNTVECTFSDLGTENPLESKDQSALEQEIRLALKALLKAQQKGVSVSVVLDSNLKCTTTGGLYLQYNRLFDNQTGPLNGQSLLDDCYGLSTNIDSALKNNFLKAGGRLYWVHPKGQMQDNFCIIDDKILWYVTSGLNESLSQKPVFSLTLKSPKENTGENPGGNTGDGLRHILDQFSFELGLLKNNLTGKLKSPIEDPAYQNLGKAQILMEPGPQNNPDKHFLDTFTNTADVILYSSGASGLATDFEAALQYRFYATPPLTQHTKILFSDSRIFDQNSLVQGFFLSPGYCLYRETFCTSHLNYLNTPPDRSPVHILLAKTAQGLKKTVFYNGNLNSESANDDSILLEIVSAPVYDYFWKIFNQISLSATPIWQTAALPSANEVIINEIQWMGSVNNMRQKKTSDEAFELYNTSNHAIDISGLSVACTDSLMADNTNVFFQIPAGVILQAGQYLAVAAGRNGAFRHAGLVIPGLAFGNTSRECLLLDERTPAGNYRPALSASGHYYNPQLQGQIIDRVSDYKNEPWNQNASHFYSRSGLNTLKYGVRGEGSRSMERISSFISGAAFSNWHTNTNETSQNTNPLDFQYFTFNTLGYPNSASPQKTDGSIIITEVHWMGSYDLYGTSHPEDEFVEFFNQSAAPKNIGGWIFGCATDFSGAAGGPLFALPYGTIIGPGQWFAVQRKGAGAFLNHNLELDFTLNNSITQCILTDADYTKTSFTGSDANGNGVLDGNYDQVLFPGTVVDFVSDRSATLDALGLGVNDTAQKIRRSCERVFPVSSGFYISSWQSNSFNNAALNYNIFDLYRQNTFATPGNPNSP